MRSKITTIHFKIYFSIFRRSFTKDIFTIFTPQNWSQQFPSSSGDHYFQKVFSTLIGFTILRNYVSFRKQIHATEFNLIFNETPKTCTIPGNLEMWMCSEVQGNQWYHWSLQNKIWTEQCVWTFFVHFRSHTAFQIMI